MIVLNRRDAARFRGAVRRCVVGRPRGLAPAVLLHQTRSELTLSATLAEVAISLRLPLADGATARTERLVAPLSLLGTIEGCTSATVMLEEVSPGRIRCQWQDNGAPKEIEEASPPPESVRSRLPVPSSWGTEDLTLMTALHSCGKAAARTEHRLALTRLQLRGEEGQIAGTDGCQLLLWDGFNFPFKENVLVPAMPIFGGREFAGEKEVRIGRTAKHVVVATGAWTIWLVIDTAARFPDVLSVIPKSPRLAKMFIDKEDVEQILRVLQSGPKDDDEAVPVTLNFGAEPVLRVENATSEKEARLSRSTCSGPTATARIDRRYLARALALGLHEVRVAASQEGVHFRDERRSYVVARLDPTKPVDGASVDRVRVSATRLPPSINGDSSMKSDSNGHTHETVDDAIDPLAEAEALRAALSEAGRRLGRLLAGLRQFQKQRRALQHAWTSLKQLRLTSKEEP